MQRELPAEFLTVESADENRFYRTRSLNMSVAKFGLDRLDQKKEKGILPYAPQHLGRPLDVYCSKAVLVRGTGRQKNQSRIG
jgi:hypothetical protein